MNKKMNCEREFDFTLVLDGSTTITQKIEDRLFEAGCDDATLSVRFGRLYLTFSRTAASLVDAMISAIQAVNSSGSGLKVMRIDECNLVTQSEIARKIGRSRQQVNQYISGQRGPAGFPAPACHITDRAPLWYWCEVAYWLWQNDLIKRDSLDEVQQVAVVNNVLELAYQRQVSPDSTNQITEALSLCCGE